jgi:hypothetical protein
MIRYRAGVGFFAVTPSDQPTGAVEELREHCAARPESAQRKIMGFPIAASEKRSSQKFLAREVRQLARQLAAQQKGVITSPIWTIICSG